ncbi:MAG: RluA family pseudouridine synthase [Opitutaceae bacterium]|nr:RluA family pseudouridine synthase [Opitutaceae bacterium]
MATRKLTWRIEAAQQDVRLDHFLAEALPRELGREITRTQVRRMIMAGAVSRNGRCERIASFTLREGTRVEAMVDLAKLDSAGPSGMRRPVVKEYVWDPARILFEDEWLLVVDKPAGLPTQPTLDESRASVFTTLKAFLEQRDGRPPYLGLHHRLDRDTSGVLLFTKEQKANLGVAALFAGKTMRKTYQALAAPGTGCPDQWEVENHLGVVGRVGKASKFGAVRSGGDAAQTSFRVLERLPGAVLVEARPHTGRTHQIRVHLAEDGHPIYGDAFYGGAMQLKAPGGGVAVSRVLLHAAELEFPHPLTDAALKIRCPLPADFESCVRPLRAPLGGKR